MIPSRALRAKSCAIEGCSIFTRLASSICESYCPRLSIDETGNCAVASRYGTAFPHKVL